MEFFPIIKPFSFFKHIKISNKNMPPGGAWVPEGRHFYHYFEILLILEELLIQQKIFKLKILLLMVTSIIL